MGGGPEEAGSTHGLDLVALICSAVWSRVDRDNRLWEFVPVSFKLGVFENGWLVLISYSVYEHMNFSPKLLYKLQVVIVPVFVIFLHK